MNPSLFRHIVASALAEDVGFGDCTTGNIFGPETGRAAIVTRQAGVAAGLTVAAEVFFQVDADLRFGADVADGDRIEPSDRLAVVEGRIAGILQAERVALNFLQRMSGIATATAVAVRAVEGTGVRITDTRKTVPGLRVLDKYAVRMGGGENHRFCLADMVLIKDNHIKGAGSIRAAVECVRRGAGFSKKIEVEAATLGQVREALCCGVDVIMLDNMTVDMMREAVGLVAGQAMVEASGSVTLERLAEVAATGVDLISLGYLTHSVRAMDIALKLG